MKILIVEDDDFQRSVLQRMLEHWGHQVCPVRDGEEALQRLLDEPYPIVITDWVMPRMNGIELVRQIRQMPRTHYIYTIIMTAKNEMNDMLEGMEAGADDFIIKPLNHKELRVRLRAGERIVQLEQKLSLQNSMLRAANEKMRQNLKAAALVQQSLLPSVLPQAEGINIAWRLQPYQELAGDTLNTFQLGQQNLVFYILDVSGHGVAAALLAVTLSRILSPHVSESTLLWKAKKNGRGHQIASPLHIAGQLNRQFQLTGRDMKYFTLVYGMLNVKNREFCYVSAGHPGLVLLRRNQEPELLVVESFPIGFTESPHYKQERLRLQSGDRLYLFSDGITEALNPQDEQFEIQGVIRALSQSRNDTLEDSLERLLKSAEDWCGQRNFTDDVTLLAFEIE